MVNSTEQKHGSHHHAPRAVMPMAVGRRHLFPGRNSSDQTDNFDSPLHGLESDIKDTGTNHRIDGRCGMRTLPLQQRKHRLLL